jgi:hypothetical protein
MRRLALVAVLCAAGAGCKARTEIMIGVATNLLAPSVLDSVHIDILRDGVPVEQQDWPIPGTRTGQYVLPGSFGVFTSDGSTPRVEVIITGEKGAVARPVVTRRSVMSLVSEKTLFLRMGLVAGCMSRDDCEKADQTCVEGVCRSPIVDLNLLPEYRPELVTHVTCASGTTFVSTDTMTPLPSLGDMSCGGVCTEGTCYVPREGGPATEALWTTQEVPPAAQSKQLRAVYATPDGHLFATGDGVIMHLPPAAGGGSGGTDNASAWIDETPAGGPTNLFALFGTSQNDVWAVGNQILHRTSSGWQQLPDSPALIALPGYQLHAGASQSTTSAHAVGRNGSGQGISVTWDGIDWTQTMGDMSLALLSPPDLKAVAAVPGMSGIVAVGNGGFVADYDGVMWRRQTNSFNNDLFGIWVGPAARGWGVGARGLILRGGNGELVSEDSGTTEDLLAVWGASDSFIFAVGNQGTVLFSRGDGQWTRQPTTTNNHLFSVSGRGAGAIYAVGQRGTLLFNDGRVVGGGSGTGNPTMDAGTGGLPDMATGGGAIACGPITCFPGDPGCTCNQSCKIGGGDVIRSVMCDGVICNCMGDSTRSFDEGPFCQNPMQAFAMCQFPGPPPP